MTYVVAEACVRCKYTDCVEVCPVDDCFREGPNFLVIDPKTCIDCGLCIQVARQEGEELGLAFVGRGFDVRVAVPFERSIADGLKKSAAKCVAACPTGALAFIKE